MDDSSDRPNSDSAPGAFSPGNLPLGSATFPVVILAAGKGTRMKSRKPKVLHPVCGKPMLRIITESAATAGLGPCVVVVSAESDAVRDALGSGCLYAVQEERLGTGHALTQAQGVIPDCDNLVVMAGDTPLLRPQTLAELTRTHLASEAPITMLTSSLTDPDGLGRVVRDSDGRIAAVVEHEEADPETLSVNEINAGTYCFRTSWLWDNLPCLNYSATGEIFLTGLVGVAASQGREVASLTVEDGAEALGINTRVELSRAESMMRDRIRRYWMMEGVTIPDPNRFT